MRAPVSAKVMTVNEVCAYLQISRSTLYRLLKRHDIPGFRIGSDWRFNIEAIDTWLRALPRGTVPIGKQKAKPLLTPQ